MQGPPARELHSFGETPLGGPPSEISIHGFATGPSIPSTNFPESATSTSTYRPSQGPWISQSVRVPARDIRFPPYNTSDPFGRVPNDTTGPQTGSVSSDSFRTQRALSASSIIFHPPTVTPGALVIKIHIQNTYNPSISETFRLRISEPFGPYLEAYCFAYGQRFRQDWIFVWAYSDPQPGDSSCYRRLIIRWHYTPMGVGRSGLPIQDGEVFRVIRSDDPSIQGSLQQSDQCELANEQAAREQSARETSRAMPSGLESQW